MVEKLKAAKNKYMALKVNQAEREYISEFSNEEINKIKEILKV